MLPLMTQHILGAGGRDGLPGPEITAAVQKYILSCEVKGSSLQHGIASLVIPGHNTFPCANNPVFFYAYVLVFGRL